jgi:uncharacterized protein YidB (DUF937 family)
MGLLDGLVGNLVGSVAGNDPKQANLANSVLSMVTNPQGGGIGGILSAFEAGVTAQQIEQILGSDKIAAMAQSAGLTPDVVKAKLTEFLPAIIDKLTPNGAVKA